MRVDISISQLCELLAFEPAQFVGIARTSDTTVTVTLEDEMGMDDVINPPDSVTVDHDRVPVLWTHDGRPLVRQAGFRCTQTTGTNPPLHDNTSRRKPGKKGGKRG